MKDSEGKWYKDKAKDLNVIPPHDAWDTIEKSMEDWPKHWYQSNFADLKSENDTKGWNAISEQLALRRNTRVALRNFYIRTAFLIAGAVLIPVLVADVGIDALSDFNVDKVGTELITDAGDFDNQNSSDKVESPNSSKTAPPLLRNIASGSNAPLLVNNDIPNETSIPENLVSEEKKSVLIALNSRQVNPLEEKNLVFDNLYTRTVGIIRMSEPNENMQEKPKNWLVGPSVLLGRSGLLNPLSYREDVSVFNPLNIPYGISASRKFNKNVITADLFFNDTKSQVSTFPSEELTTSLNYVTLALQYERVVPIFKSATRLRPELNFGAGIFGSILSNSLVSSNNINSYYTSFTYKNYDAGGVLSAGTSIGLGKYFRIGVNARIQSGVFNLFEGRAKVPDNLFRTQSLATGIQTKLSYNF